jgi:hypothetical protein
MPHALHCVAIALLHGRQPIPRSPLAFSSVHYRTFANTSDTITTRMMHSTWLHSEMKLVVHGPYWQHVCMYCKHCAFILWQLTHWPQCTSIHFLSDRRYEEAMKLTANGCLRVNTTWDAIRRQLCQTGGSAYSPVATITQRRPRETCRSNSQSASSALSLAQKALSRLSLRRISCRRLLIHSIPLHLTLLLPRVPVFIHS